MAARIRTKKWVSLALAITVALSNWNGIGGGGRASAANVPSTIDNPDFETGDLSGWTTTGTAFVDGPKKDEVFWGDHPFNQSGNYHMWNWNDTPDSDKRTGTMQSSTFRLGGNGEVNFLIGGAKNIDKFYVALVNASTGEELFKATGEALPDQFERYVRVNWDASAYIGEDLYLKVVDNGDGHINVDDFHVFNFTSEIANPGFESGNLTGWKQTGNAFNRGVISSDSYGSERKPYQLIGNFHLGGGSDEGTGTLESELFELAGSGQVNFLVSGTKDLEHEYVALVRASDGAEIFKETGAGLQDYPETYRRVIWDASDYLGQKFYIRIVDSGTGHISADDFHVYNTRHDIVNPDFETGDLTGWKILDGQAPGRVTSETNYWGVDPINKHGQYHFWGDDMAKGSFRSTNFTLGGTGEINFLIGGGNKDTQYVALRKASDDTELMRTTNQWFADTEGYTRVTWDASSYLGEELYLVVADEVAAGGWEHINVDDFNVYNLPHDIVNPGFETGDLTGWSVTDAVYTPGRVTSEVKYWHPDPINKVGEYHFWGEDGKEGTLESTHFRLAGTGEINFMIGGGNFPRTEYVALVRASDGKELMKATHEKFADSENYDRVVWDASPYLGQDVFIRVVDQVKGGGWQHVNVDDFHVYNTDKDTIPNPGFESGDLNGWTVEGDAFSLTDATMAGSVEFGQVGRFHVFGGGNDELSGSLTSSSFKLNGTGEVNFLIGGSNDIDNQYVELVNQLDGATLFKATGDGSEAYKRIVWHAKDYLGKKVFIRVVDKGTGHVNVDDFNVLTKVPVSYLLTNEDFESGGLRGWTAEGNAFSVVEGQSSNINGYQRHKFAEGSKEGQGSLTSNVFRLTGTGKVNFKIGGDADSRVYVSLIRSADGKEIKKVSPDGSSGLKTVEWDVSQYLNELLYFKVVDQSPTGRIHVDDFNCYVSSMIINPDFETGDLQGWQVVEGNAFEGVVTSAINHHGSDTFNQHGKYHLWGFQGGGDDRTGVLESSHFLLGGTGRITFLIAGGYREASDTLGVQLIRDSTGEVIDEATGFDDEKYKRIDWDAKAYMGEELYFRIVDRATGGWGHINADDFRTLNPFGSIENNGFETGDFTGWTMEGDAFKQSISQKPGYGHEGDYYVYGKASGDDSLTGSLKSRTFELTGNGKITFLIAGGNDPNNLYAALVNAKNNEVIYKATGSNSDMFREVSWDASSYLGQEVYLEIVDDKKEGPFGYISVDDFQMSTPTSPYAETFRPQYHYSPAKNWMNDPNGLVYYEGEYHLFYQHTPFSTQPDFGRMHWGHAVSKDLVHWEELPPALAPDEDGAMFSGSAVVDKNNTTGFFEEEGSGLVAIYTNNDNKKQPGKPQVESIAYSKDKGRTWIKYEGNPVLFPKEGADFRDPKVFWYEPTSRWVMALAVKDRVEFYTSPNLKDWTYASSFGAETVGTHRGIYECPDVFPIYVDGNPTNQKWVMLLSVGDRNGTNPNDPDTPAGGSGMMYFIGNFDGTTFTPDEPVNSVDNVKWLDFGSDFYAAVTWNNISEADGRKMVIGWMNNWHYSGSLPTGVWRGNMSIPRELKLKTYPEGVRLIQTPVEELNSLRTPLTSLQDVIVSPDVDPTAGMSAAKALITAEFELGTATEFGFKVHKSSNEETIVGYDVVGGEMFVDRTQSGAVGFNPAFGAKHKAKLEPENNRVKLKIYVDWASVEAFGNDGKAVISDTIFPGPGSNGLETYAVGGDAKLVSLQIDDMQSIWRDESFSKIRMDKRNYKLMVNQNHESIVYAVTVSDTVEKNGAPLIDVTGKSQYKSSNPNIASVNERGVVTAVSPGTTIITATYGNYSTTAEVNVVGKDVDRSALQAALVELQKLKKSSYTPNSWSVFHVALEAALAVNADNQASQAKIDGALSGLNAAAAALVLISGEEVPDKTGPGQVRSASVVTGDGMLTVSWEDPSDADLSKIRISVRSNRPLTSIYVDPRTQKAVLTGLTNGVVYRLSLVAIDSSGNESTPVEVEGTPVASTVPYTPPASQGNGEPSIDSTVLRLQARPDASGRAVVGVTASELNSAIKAMRGNALRVKIEPTAATSVISLQLQLQPIIDAARNGKLAALVVDTSFALVTLDAKWLADQTADATAMLTLDVKLGDIGELSDETKRRLAGAKGYDFSLSVGDKKLENFDGNVVKIALPYALKKGENPGRVIVYYVNSAGQLELVRNARYDAATQTVTFAPKHFSLYAAAYSDVSFLDIEGLTWAKDSIEALAARGAIQGIGGGSFNPGGSVTRAEFVTMLMRMFEPTTAGKELDSTFADVAAGKWYSDSIATAHRLGIVTGRTDGTFGISQPVTRQEMAVMLYRMADVLKLKLVANGRPVKAAFSDAARIQAYAADAVEAMREAGIVQGMDDGSFQPNAASTRAQAAVLIYRLFLLG